MTSFSSLPRLIEATQQTTLKTMPALESVVVAISAAAAGLFSVLGAISSMDGITTGYGMAGAIGGALVAICFMDSSNYRTMTRKLVASTLWSLIIGGKVLEWFGWDIAPTNILFVYGLVAFSSWSILQALQSFTGPMLIAWFESLLQSLKGKPK